VAVPGTEEGDGLDDEENGRRANQVAGRKLARAFRGPPSATTAWLRPTWGTPSLSDPRRGTPRAGRSGRTDSSSPLYREPQTRRIGGIGVCPYRPSIRYTSFICP
jgi:hypothetical protein